MLLFLPIVFGLKGERGFSMNESDPSDEVKTTPHPEVDTASPDPASEASESDDVLSLDDLDDRDRALILATMGEVLALSICADFGPTQQYVLLEYAVANTMEDGVRPDKIVQCLASDVLNKVDRGQISEGDKFYAHLRDRRARFEAQREELRRRLSGQPNGQFLASVLGLDDCDEVCPGCEECDGPEHDEPEAVSEVKIVNLDDHPNLRNFSAEDVPEATGEGNGELH